METLLPVLAQRMGVGTWGQGSVRELTPPR